MTSLRPLLSLLAVPLLLTACTPDAEQAKLDTYLSEAEEIGTQLEQEGGRLETLMNVQADITAWTEEEKTELADIMANIDALTDESADMEYPILLKDVHPVLIEAMQELQASVHGLMKIAEDPANITDELAADIETRATHGETLANDYSDKLTEAVADSL